MLKKILSIEFFFRATIWLLVFGFALPVFAGSVDKKNYVNKYIIKIKQNTPPKKLEKIGFNIKKLFSFTNNKDFINLYSFESDLTESDILKKIGQSFEYLEKPTVFYIQGITTNDPGFTSNFLEIDKQWGLVKVGFDKAWVKTTGSKKNIVAVIDTGVDATHEDLQNIIFVDGFDFFTKQVLRGNLNTDNNGHGTLVAGVLGATANNGKGIVGANWQVSIMPLKALDENGIGDSTKIAEAIVWATDHGAKIINLSIGGIGLEHDTTLNQAISYAFSKDVLIVAAAGNDSVATGSDLTNKPVFPICSDNNKNMVLGVSAVDQLDLKPEFANYGKNCIDIVAPGKRILSTINFDPLTKKIAPNSYAYASGTSLAVPFVVAQASLLRTLYPNASNVQIRDQILTTADSVAENNLTQCGGGSCKDKLGAGRINVEKSLNTDMVIPIAHEGDLIKLEHTNTFYEISGGQKRPVSSFVFSQRFLNFPYKTLSEGQLNIFPLGQYASPRDGTLIKLEKSRTIYHIENGQKWPVSAKIFKQRHLNSKEIFIVNTEEFNSWNLANFLPPSEGTIVRTLNKKNIYWVVGGVLHQINQSYIFKKGIGNFPYMYFSEKEIKSFPKGESYLK